MLPCAFHVCVGTITHAVGGGKVNQTELADMAFVTFVETQHGRSRAGLTIKGRNSHTCQHPSPADPCSALCHQQKMLHMGENKENCMKA